MRTTTPKNEKKTEEKVETLNEVASVDNSKNDHKTSELNWAEILELNNIGNFPFITAPTGLAIFREKNGLTDIFDSEIMQSYTGAGIITTEGKLGVLRLEGVDNKEFNQKIFDRSVKGYLSQIGAKEIYLEAFLTMKNLKNNCIRICGLGKI